MPFLADEAYMRVQGEKESVHLDNWPEPTEFDAGVLEQMQKVREIVTKSLELRQKAGHKVRQPLASLSIPENFSAELLEIIADEVNVKEVKISEGEIELDTILTDELKKEGIARDIIRGIQDARKKENLNPSEKIKLVVYTSESKKSIIESKKNMIQLPTQVTEISYASNKQEHSIIVDGEEVSVSIIR